MTFDQHLALWYVINLLIWLNSLIGIRQEGLHPNSEDARFIKFFCSFWGLCGLLPVMVPLVWALMGLEKLEAKYL